jgi:hypothetical protein
LLTYHKSKTAHTWAEKYRRDDGIQCYFEQLLYTADSTCTLRSAEPLTDQEWECFIAAANRVGSAHNWSAVGISLHHPLPASSCASALSHFRVVSPSNSPHPWLDREALKQMGSEEREMSNRLIQPLDLTELDRDELAATLAVLRGKYRRAENSALSHSARVLKAPRVRVKKTTS